ncbi:MAG: zinc ribbon domain-containing protein [Nitrososphaerota archaeon]|nr:zinc ribbon domain-containing protein [Nitrososphaerota archaeon]
MPYWWYKARKTLRETAYIETLPESAYTYPPPPTPLPYQPTQATNAKANFCPKCGTPIKSEANFCKNCGKQI